MRHLRTFAELLWYWLEWEYRYRQMERKRKACQKQGHRVIMVGHASPDPALYLLGVHCLSCNQTYHGLQLPADSKPAESMKKIMEARFIEAVLAR